MSLNPERCEDYRLDPSDESLGDRCERHDREFALDTDDLAPNPFRVTDEEMSGGEP